MEKILANIPKLVESLGAAGAGGAMAALALGVQAVLDNWDDIARRLKEGEAS